MGSQLHEDCHFDETPEFDENNLRDDDMDKLRCQLKHNLAAALFLQIKSLLIHHLNQISLLSKPLIYCAIQMILDHHCPNVDVSIVTEIINAVFGSNTVKHTSTGGSLSTACTTASYTAREFPSVKLVEFVKDNEKQLTVYMPSS